MNIYEQMKLWRMERDEMERVCKETKENCCKRYSKKNDQGGLLIDGGCENCPLMYTTRESADVTPWNITGEKTVYRCMAKRPLKEFYDFITKETENGKD